MGFEQLVDELLRDAIRQYDDGELVVANRLCAEALSLDPQDSAALHLSGLIANDQGDPRQAAQFLALAVRSAPDDADAWNDFGNVLQRCGELQQAMDAFGQAMRLAPDFADAHSNYGYMLLRQAAFAESIEHFQNAIAIEPGFTLAYNNLGSAFLEMRRYDEAIAAFRAAIESSPQSADGYVNLGNALRRSDRHAESIEMLLEGCRRAANCPELLLNLGGTYKDLGQLDKAQTAYEHAILARPVYAEAHWNLSLLLLARGDLERGWENFEWRRKVKGIAADIWPRNSREWTGQAVAGQTVLLVAEQGLGDTLQFIRYASVLKEHGAIVIAAAQRELLQVLAGCDGVDQLVPLCPPFPPHDFFCLCMSLPRLLSPDVESIPRIVPYICADEKLIAQWRARLESIKGFRVGIGWQGNPNYAADRYRSIPLQRFESLARIPGVRLISLQRGFGSEQLAAVREQFPIVDLGQEIDKLNGPFIDTAAIMRNLDLVISSDTVLVHLAGALGVPVWMPTSFVPDWRWFFERKDSPWYPTLRLFRQRERLIWEPVFEEIAKELACSQALPGNTRTGGSASAHQGRS
jgi:Tfp pilus assembly protein PilF